jgi:hypothetical protein
VSVLAGLDVRSRSGLQAERLEAERLDASTLAYGPGPKSW